MREHALQEEQENEREGLSSGIDGQPSPVNFVNGN